MRCKRCGAIDFTSFIKRRIICKKCDNHMKSLVYGLVEYSNLLYSMFMKKEIVESDYIFKTCIDLCDNLLIYEKLGIKVLDEEVSSQINMKSFIYNISDFKKQLIEIDKDIKETNIRRNLYNNAEAYEKDYEFENALEEYIKIHEMYPSHIGPILSIADMHRKLNELDKAIDFLLKAKETPYYNSIGNKHISYRHNLDKRLKDLEDRKSRGYVYRPRKRKDNS